MYCTVQMYCVLYSTNTTVCISISLSLSLTHTHTHTHTHTFPFYRRGIQVSFSIIFVFTHSITRSPSLLTYIYISFCTVTSPPQAHGCFPKNHLGLNVKGFFKFSTSIFLNFQNWFSNKSNPNDLIDYWLSSVELRIQQISASCSSWAQEYHQMRSNYINQLRSIWLDHYSGVTELNLSLYIYISKYENSDQSENPFGA